MMELSPWRTMEKISIRERKKDIRVENREKTKEKLRPR